MSKKPFWIRGDMSRVAELSGVDVKYMSDVLHRRKGVSPQKAKVFEKASKRALRLGIPFEDWVFNKSSDHPAFFGIPQALTYKE